MRLPTCGAQVQNKGLTALWGNLKGPVSITLTGPLFCHGGETVTLTVDTDRITDRITEGTMLTKTTFDAES